MDVSSYIWEAARGHGSSTEQIFERLLLMAGAGDGKTTLVHTILCKLAEHGAVRETKLIPILADCVTLGSFFRELDDEQKALHYVYPGSLYAQIPGADLEDYLRTAESLLPILPPETRIFCAHGRPDQQRQHRAPMLTRDDIADLGDALNALKQSGQQPEKWPVNARMSLLTAASAYASWQ
jgi:hypothetical protein